MVSFTKAMATGVAFAKASATEEKPVFESNPL